MERLTTRGDYPLANPLDVILDILLSWNCSTYEINQNRLLRLSAACDFQAKFQESFKIFQKIVYPLQIFSHYTNELVHYS